MGKRLEGSLSPAVSAGYSPPNRYALHTRRKQKKFTKLGELSGRLRPDSMAGTTHAELGQSGSQRFFAIYAEKEKKKMTHLKPITFKLQLTEQPQNFFQLIEAVIEEEATSP